VIETVLRRTDNVVNLAGIFGPANAPTGWAGYWASYQALGAIQTAQSDAGPNASAPSATVAGSLRLWNGSGYNTYPLTNWTGAVTDQTGSCSPTSLCITEVHSCLATGGAYFKFDISGTLAVGRSYVSQAPAGATGTTQRTDSLAVVGAPLTGTIRYVVTRYTNATCTAGASTLTDLTLAVDLGSLVAHSAYVPS
jgi:hypothetical protein